MTSINGPKFHQRVQSQNIDSNGSNQLLSIEDRKMPVKKTKESDFVISSVNSTQ